MSFRNDYLGILQEVYRYDEAGRRTHVLPTLKQDLKEFATSLVCHSQRSGILCLYRNSRDLVAVISSIHFRGIM